MRQTSDFTCCISPSLLRPPCQLTQLLLLGTQFFLLWQPSLPIVAREHCDSL